MDRYKERRAELIKKIKEDYAPADGVLLFIADTENERNPFLQESTFYYFTGISEPGVMLLVDLYGNETLYIPHFNSRREQWVRDPLLCDEKTAKRYGLKEIEYLGGSVEGYTFPLLCEREHVDVIAGKLKEIVGLNGSIYTPQSSNPLRYVKQKVLLERLKHWVDGLEDALKDTSSIIASMRRTKSKYEIEQLYRAIDLTILAHQNAAMTIGEDMRECEIQAGIKYIFREAGEYPAFPSIVATGKNSTILHYEPQVTMMKKGELAVVDIGAMHNHYCADLTRTYPVAGAFTKRQREVYNVVLATQEYIASIAAPGYWLNNKNEPDKSLHHCAVKFLTDKGFGQYISHGIGHFLGLDVHDVGDASMPLREGDVITIEPGVYIPEEQIGIRIEDDYWIIKDGSLCLSENLPREADDIEEAMHVTLEELEESSS